MTGGVAVRFAPSPTGPLHVGSARTALLNVLFARAQGGTLLLRIDDTDPERSRPEFEQEIRDTLAEVLGITWDRSYRQSDRADRYREMLTQNFTPSPDGSYVWNGRVIARSDGSVLYNLATAIDDVDDQITHVMRGRDHLANTELQRSLIGAIGATPPVYVHAPLVIFPDGGKLSKRGDGAHTVAALHTEGYLGSAICNALALSLADFGTDEVMLNLDQMAARFDLANLHTADSRFDPDKLAWISGQHIRALADEALAAELERLLGFKPAGVALAAARTGGSTLRECADTVLLLTEPPVPDQAAAKLAATDEARAAVRLLRELSPIPPADLAAAEALFANLKLALKEAGVALGPALRGLRAILTGRTEGPELRFVLASLSREQLDEIANLA